MVGLLKFASGIVEGIKRGRVRGRTINSLYVPVTGVDKAAPGQDKTFIRWETIAGDKYEGYVVEMDSNVAVVKCSDGQTRTVEL